MELQNNIVIISSISACEFFCTDQKYGFQQPDTHDVHSRSRCHKWTPFSGASFLYHILWNENFWCRK